MVRCSHSHQSLQQEHLLIHVIIMCKQSNTQTCTYRLTETGPADVFLIFNNPILVCLCTLQPRDFYSWLMGVRTRCGIALSGSIAHNISSVVQLDFFFFAHHCSPNSSSFRYNKISCQLEAVQPFSFKLSYWQGVSKCCSLNAFCFSHHSV